MHHRLYFSPGIFGFGRLASYDYFAHLVRALSDRIRAAGDTVETHVAQVAPTASIRRRAATLVELVTQTCEPSNPRGGPIHLIGHSTGGLDARLVASSIAPSSMASRSTAWHSRLASITTMNAPHLGTPLASFFTTVSGARVLRALSALTFIALTIGSPPLSAVSALVVALSRIDRALGLEIGVIDRATETLLHLLDDARSAEVREYVDAVTKDQGAMVQLMPEAMDLFGAGVVDCPGVYCQSTASMAPAPGAATFVRTLGRPWRTTSAMIFAALHGISSRCSAMYPCALPDAGRDAEERMMRAFGSSPGVRANDGVVPIRSQVWGKLVWVGHGDHLDVLGHFTDSSRRSRRGREEESLPHVDWLFSGSSFGRDQFEAMTGAIADGLLRCVRTPGASQS
jgi:triacylglycerol esterase/lipase EstA (alpha/beta hydrolase family)